MQQAECKVRSQKKREQKWMFDLKKNSEQRCPISEKDED